MSSYTVLLNKQYSPVNVFAGICRALHAQGKGLRGLRREDCTPFDEFHSGGIYATRELARAAGLQRGDYVFDAGCGIGGPARTLAAEFGCRVLGMDISSGFIRAARELTRLLNMENAAAFTVGDASRVPVTARAFDAVWSQNTIMNMPDKRGFFVRCAEAVRHGGTLAVEAVCLGSNGRGMRYPVFWADTPAISYLASKEELLEAIASAGFSVDSVYDTTAVTITGQQRRLELMRQGEQPPGLEVIVPVDYKAKVTNSLRNNESGATESLRLACRLP